MFFFFLNYIVSEGKMALVNFFSQAEKISQAVKWLLGKHEHLISGPRYHLEKIVYSNALAVSASGKQHSRLLDTIGWLN